MQIYREEMLEVPKKDNDTVSSVAQFIENEVGVKVRSIQQTGDPEAPGERSVWRVKILRKLNP